MCFGVNKQAINNSVVAATDFVLDDDDDDDVEKNLINRIYSVIIKKFYFTFCHIFMVNKFFCNKTGKIIKLVYFFFLQGCGFNEYTVRSLSELT